MKKRLWSLAVMVGLIFALGIPAFAAIEVIPPEEVEADANITKLEVTSRTSTNSTLREVVSSDVIVFTATFNSNTGASAPDLSISEGTFNDYFDYDWEPTGGFMNLTTDGDPDTSTELTYTGTITLTITPKEGSATNDSSNSTYNITATRGGVSTKFTILVEPWAKAPEFETAASMSRELGSKTNTQIALSNYDTDEVTWGIDDDGKAALAEMNLVFNTSTAIIGLSDTTTGINYGSSGSAKFTITATANKNPKPAASQEFTITVTGAEKAALPTAPSAADLGKAYDAGGQGLYLDDTIKKGNTLFTFEASGTLPLYFSYTGLPEGLTFTPGDNEPTAEGGWGKDTKNGTREAYITGTPSEEGEYEFTIVVSNDVDTTGVKKTYKITTLEIPTLDGDEVKTVTWGKAIEDTTTFKAENFVGGTTGITWAIDAISDLTADDLAKLGLTFDTSTGEISGTWKENGTSNGLLNFGSGNVELTKNLIITATKFEKTATANLAVTFVMTPPVMNIPDMTFIYDEASIDKTITASGAGTITWGAFPADLANLGLEYYTSFDSDGAATMTVYGRPNYTLYPKTEYVFTASNAAGTSENGAAGVEIKTEKVVLTFEEDTLPSGDFQLNTTFGPITISAKPGPIEFSFVPDTSGKTKTNFEQKWKPTIVSGDDDNGEESIISGTFSEPTGIYTVSKTGPTIKTRGYITYKIVATNTDYDVSESTGSRYLYVHDVAQITTDQKNKAWTFKSGSVLKQAITANIDVNSWDIQVSFDGSDGWQNAGEGTGKAKVDYIDSNSGIESEGSYYMTIANDPKKPTAAVIAGSLDRIPAGGNLQVRVIAISDGGMSSKDFNVTVTGDAPKLGKATMDVVPAGTDIWSWDIPATGTKPLFMKAYIAQKDAQKIFGVNDDVYIGGYADYKDDAAKAKAKAHETDSIETGFTFDFNEETGMGKLLFERAGDGEGYAYKGLPVTIQMVNQVNYDATFNNGTKNKATTGSVKPTVTANKAPSWYVLSGDAYVDIKSVDVKSAPTYNETAGKAFSGYKFLVKGDGPVVVTLPAKFPTGLTVTSSDAGDEYAADGRIYEISGTPDGKNETKNKISLTAKNNSTGGSGKADVTIVGMTIPKITTKNNVLAKNVLVGGKLSLKGAASGTKDITWEILDTAYSSDATTDIESYGLTLDAAKGTVAGTAGKVTVDSNGDYAPINIYLAARNDAGITSDAESNPALKLTVGIAGAKASLTTKTISLYRGVDGFGLASPDALLKTNAGESVATATESTKVKYAVEADKNGKNAATLAGLGLSTEILRVDDTGAASATGNFGRLQLAENVTDLTANKGASVKFSADNYGTAINGSVKIVVYDPKPVITATGGTSETVTLSPSDTEAATETIHLTLTDATLATGDSKVTWKVGSTKAAKPLTAKVAVRKTDLNDVAEKYGNFADVTVTLAKGSTEGGSFTVVATNSSGKQASEEFLITVNNANAAVPEDVAEAPEEEAEAETETEAEEEAEVETEPEADVEEEPEEEESKGTLTFGEARTVDSLTTEQKAFIEASGYKVVAVLPAVTAAEDGLHDINDIALAEDSPVGAELVYFPFPAETEEGEEEGSTLFYDETGDITAVPEGKVVTVSTWFYADRVYTPVVAVKVGNASDTVNTEEEVKENAADATTEAEVVPETEPETEAADPETVEE